MKHFTASRGQESRWTARGALARRAGTLAFAATLLAAPAARAQRIYNPVPAAHAQQALSAFLGGVSGQIDGGENPPRDRATNGTMMWHDANTVEMILDYYDATKDGSFLPIVNAYVGYDPMQPFSWAFGAIQQNNAANDDLLWWALSFIHAYRVTGNRWFLAEAEQVFDQVCVLWNTQGCGGGVPWYQPNNGGSSVYVNAIVNELFLETAAQLATVDPGHAGVCSAKGSAASYANTYEGWAWAEYDWFSQYWFYPGATIPLPDGINLPQYGSCAPQGTQWTYNQGPILGAMIDLANIARGESSPHVASSAILERGIEIAQAAMAPVSSGGLSQNGILTELDDIGGSQDGCLNDPNGNCPEFKGVFMRYLSDFVNGVGPWQGASQAPLNPFLLAAVPYLQQNASAIWANSWSPGMLTENWSIEQTYGSDPSQDTETSGLDGLIAAISSPMVLAAPVVNVDPVSITGLSESAGYTGDEITVTGAGFGTNGVITFSFGGAISEPMYGCASPTSCLVQVPPGAGSVYVTATVGGATSLPTDASDFNYEAPRVTGVSPAIGSSVGGTPVTITGFGFNMGMSLSFGNTPAPAGWWCESSTSCTAVTPPDPNTGVVDVKVVVDGVGSPSSAADQFTFLYLPIVTSVTTASGPWWDDETLMGTLTLNEPAPSSGTQVTLSVDAGGGAAAAGVTVPATVSLPGGATSIQFPITTGASPASFVRIHASTYGGSLSSAWWPVYSGDIAVAPWFDLGSGGSGDLTVFVRNPPGAGGGSLGVASSSASLTAPSSPVVIDAGAYSVAVPLKAAAVTGATSATVTLSYEGSTLAVPVNIMAPLKVLPPIKVPFHGCIGLCQ